MFGSVTVVEKDGTIQLFENVEAVFENNCFEIRDDHGGTLLLTTFITDLSIKENIITVQAKFGEAVKSTWVFVLAEGHKKGKDLRKIKDFECPDHGVGIGVWGPIDRDYECAECLFGLQQKILDILKEKAEEQDDEDYDDGHLSDLP